MKKYLAHILFIATFGGVFLVGGSSASAATLTWDGGGDNTTWSDGTNWDTDSVPVDGDDLVFDLAALADGDAHINDLTGLNLNSITVSGDNSAGSYFSVDVSGNPITSNNINLVNDTAADNWRVSFSSLDIDITLLADAEISNNVRLNNLDLGGYNLTFSSTDGPYYPSIDTLSGSGNIVVSNGSLNVLANNGTSDFTGQITAASGSSIGVYSPDSYPSASRIIVEDGASISFAKSDNPYTTPITLTGVGADYGSGPTSKIRAFPSLGFGGGAPGSADGTATISDLTLDNDVIFGGWTNLEVLSLTGDYTITPEDGSVGSVTLPGGETIEAEDKTIVIEPGDENEDARVFIGSKLTVFVNGVRGDVDISTGGVLKGSGTVGDIYASGGRIEPGSSPGCLTASNISGGAVLTVFQVEIAGTTACTEYDQLVLTDGATTNIDGLSLEVVHLNEFASNGDDTFTIVRNTGTDPITGTFDGLAEAATFVANGMTYRINYNAGEGNNDIVLTRVAVPGEPTTGLLPQITQSATWSLLLGATLLGGSAFALAKRKN